MKQFKFKNMAKKKEETNKITELETKVAELENQLKRAVADYHNLEKRVNEGRSELTAWGTTELLTKMLTVLDYLEQATSGASEVEKSSGWFRGVELAIKQFKDVLKSEGLDEIVADPSTALGTGSVFDPSLHEALDTKEGEDNKILKVVRRGYKSNGKVLRPAGVIVGRKLESSSENQESREEGKGESV